MPQSLLQAALQLLPTAQKRLVGPPATPAMATTAPAPAPAATPAAAATAAAGSPTPSGVSEGLRLEQMQQGSSWRGFTTRVAAALTGLDGPPVTQLDVQHFTNRSEGSCFYNLYFFAPAPCFASSLRSVRG